jgi:hypothetical protein
MPAYNSHSITLYCDNHRVAPTSYPEPIHGQHVFGEFPKEYLSTSEKKAMTTAIDDGWRFYKNGRTLCPRCVKNGIRLGKNDILRK